MNRAPVTDSDAVEVPITLEDVEQENGILARVVTVIFVITGHDRPCSAVNDSGLEAGKIDLMESAVVDKHVHMVAVDLLVV